jgi:hypothetical protein
MLCHRITLQHCEKKFIDSNNYCPGTQGAIIAIYSYRPNNIATAIAFETITKATKYNIQVTLMFSYNTAEIWIQLE